MIVGADILMGQNAILPYPPYNEALNVLKLQNGVYDDLLLSRDADKDYGKYNLDNGWQAQTAIYWLIWNVTWQTVLPKQCFRIQQSSGAVSRN